MRLIQRDKRKPYKGWGTIINCIVTEKWYEMSLCMFPRLQALDKIINRSVQMEIFGCWSCIHAIKPSSNSFRTPPSHDCNLSWNKSELKYSWIWVLQIAHRRSFCHLKYKLRIDDSFKLTPYIRLLGYIDVSQDWQKEILQYHLYSECFFRRGLEWVTIFLPKQLAIRAASSVRLSAHAEVLRLIASLLAVLPSERDRRQRSLNAKIVLLW